MPDRTIFIRACVFGGRYVVTIEPRRVDWPSVECPAIAKARDCAAALAADTGWPIVDKTGEDTHG